MTEKCGWGEEALAFMNSFFHRESTKVVDVDGHVVLAKDILVDVLVQSHLEVELHRNRVVHAGLSQAFLHLLEVLVDGLGSLYGVLHLV